MSFEGALEQIIKRAEREGAFDELRGAGKPLEYVDTRADPAWWLSYQKLREEGLQLPPPESIAQRRELDDIGDLINERQVRSRLALLNVRIAKTNRLGTGGPGQLAPVDIEGFVARWRVRRHL